MIACLSVACLVLIIACACLLIERADLKDIINRRTADLDRLRQDFYALMSKRDEAKAKAHELEQIVAGFQQGLNMLNKLMKKGGAK